MVGGVAEAVRTAKDSVSCAMRTVAGVTMIAMKRSEAAIGGAATVIETAATVITTLPNVQWRKRVVTR